MLVNKSTHLPSGKWTHWVNHKVCWDHLFSSIKLACHDPRYVPIPWPSHSNRHLPKSAAQVASQQRQLGKARRQRQLGHPEAQAMGAMPRDKSSTTLCFFIVWVHPLLYFTQRETNKGWVTVGFPDPCLPRLFLCPRGPKTRETTTDTPRKAPRLFERSDLKHGWAHQHPQNRRPVLRLKDLKGTDHFYGDPGIRLVSPRKLWGPETRLWKGNMPRFSW